MRINVCIRKLLVQSVEYLGDKGELGLGLVELPDIKFFVRLQAFINVRRFESNSSASEYFTFE